VAQSTVDQERSRRNQRRAGLRKPRRNFASSRRARPEPIDQATAAVAAARRRFDALKLTRDRLTVRAPRRGRIDALPFQAGRSAARRRGARQHARRRRAARVRAGAAAPKSIPARASEITVEGIATPFTAKLRSSAAPGFTPYYALAGDDASRLVFRAELLLDSGAGVAGAPGRLP
jgi:HlyD family secretion protein